MSDELKCRYCHDPMDRRITRNPYNRRPAEGDVCRLCLLDDALDYAGVDSLKDQPRDEEQEDNDGSDSSAGRETLP